MTRKAPVLTGKGKAPKKAEPAERERTPEEQQQYDKQMKRWKARPIRPVSTIEQSETDGRMVTKIDRGKDQDSGLYSVSMFEALGTSSIPFLNHTLDNVVRVMSPARDISSDQHNASLAFLAAVEPENEVEATLGAQMFAANEAAMRCLRLMANSETLEQHKVHGGLANKFMRTFAAQAEALAKLRRKGEQIVKHVHVYEGGQAVVAGTINQQRGEYDVTSEEQPCGAGTVAVGPEMLGYDAAGNGMPISRDAERTVQDTRGPEPWSA